MQLVLAACLPRDDYSIPVARHIVRDALREIGVDESCIYDIEVAQSERPAPTWSTTRVPATSTR